MAVDLDKLGAAFPKAAIKQRSAGGGRMLDYVEGHVVIHRLNDATGNCWDMTVREITSKQVGENTLMIAHVALTIPGLGTREGLGVQMVHVRGGEDLVKGCITDGLKKAATLFGVGLELYGPDYENTDTPVQRNSSPSPERRQNPTPIAPERPTEAAAQPQQAIHGGVSEPQIRNLYRLGKKLGWTEDDFHVELFHAYEHYSVKELTKQQASDWIKALMIAAGEAEPQQGTIIDVAARAVDGEAGFDRFTEQ